VQSASGKTAVPPVAVLTVICFPVGVQVEAAQSAKISSAELIVVNLLGAGGSRCRRGKCEIECRKTDGLQRKPLGQPVLIKLRRSLSAMRGSSRQAASPTMNQAGCSVCATMRQVTSAPRDDPTGVSLCKLAGTQLW
jgi:hypothetical protein